jgi:hypothetical protein
MPGLWLVQLMERYRDRWNLKKLADLARQLRELAEALEKPYRGGKKKRRVEIAAQRGKDGWAENKKPAALRPNGDE